MSLLHQEEHDGAARGEEFTKGTSHVVIAAVIAAVVVTVIVAIYVIAGQKPALATGEVIGVWAHPLHTQTSGYDAGGVPIPQETFDQVMVFARVRIYNQSKTPLFLWNIASNATLADGIHTSWAASTSDYDRIFVAYPNLTVPHGKALARETEIDPGQTVEGNFVSVFNNVTKEQWEARKALNFTFAFRYQPNLVLTPKVTVIQQ
jgi:hypothetical protein